MLRQAEQSRLRSDASVMLEQTCQIYSRTLSADGYGNQDVSTSPRFTSACRVVVKRGQVQPSGPATPEVDRVDILFPPDTILESSDLLEVDGEQYSIVGFALSSMALYLSVRVVRLAT